MPIAACPSGTEIDSGGGIRWTPDCLGIHQEQAVDRILGTVGMTRENTNSTLRSEVDALLTQGQSNAVALRLGDLWRMESDSATAAFVVSKFEKLRDKIPLVPFRLAILRSFTVEPVVPLLRAAAFCRGIDLSIHLGDFNAYAQEILDSESALYRFAPDAAILAAQTVDIAPDLWLDYAHVSEEAVGQIAQRVSGSIGQWMRAFRGRSQAALIVHTLEQPSRLSLGLLDCQREASQSNVIQHINHDICRSAREL